MTSLVPFSALLGRATKNAHFKKFIKNSSFNQMQKFFAAFFLIPCKDFTKRKKFFGVIGTLITLVCFYCGLSLAESSKCNGK